MGNPEPSSLPIDSRTLCRSALINTTSQRYRALRNPYDFIATSLTRACHSSHVRCPLTEAAVEARRQQIRDGRCQSTMWVFLILMSLGLVFMLYVLVQFFREGKRRTSNRQHSSNPNTGKRQTGRVVTTDSIQSARKNSSSKRHTANGVMVMGKFRSGLLALMVVWPWAAYAQAQDAPPASQGDPKVSQGQAKELVGITAFSSNAPALLATQRQPAAYH